MDLTLLHPKLVHLPIALSVLMPLLSGGLLMAWWRGWLPRRTWLIAVACSALLTISAGAAMYTGEVDEEIVERVVAERHIEAHEEAAEVFMWTSFAILGLFVIGAALRRERLALGFATSATLGTIVVLGLGVRVGAAGGDLVYIHGAARAFSGLESVKDSSFQKEQEFEKEDD